MFIEYSSNCGLTRDRPSSLYGCTHSPTPKDNAMKEILPGVRTNSRMGSVFRPTVVCRSIVLQTERGH